MLVSKASKNYFGFQDGGAYSKGLNQEEKFKENILQQKSYQPPVTGKIDMAVRTKSKWTLPDKVGTDLRNDIQEVDIPEISSNVVSTLVYRIRKKQKLQKLKQLNSHQ